MFRHSQIPSLKPVPGDQGRSKHDVKKVTDAMKEGSHKNEVGNYVCNCSDCNGKEFKTRSGLRQHYQTILANQGLIPMLLCTCNVCLVTSVTRQLLISHFARNHIEEAGFEIAKIHKRAGDRGEMFTCILSGCPGKGSQFFRNQMFSHYNLHHSTMEVEVEVEVESKFSFTPTSSEFDKIFIGELNRFYLYNELLVNILCNSVITYMFDIISRLDLNDAVKNNILMNLCGTYCMFFSEMIDSPCEISSDILNSSMDKVLPKSIKELLKSMPEQSSQLKSSVTVKLWAVVIKNSLSPTIRLSDEKTVELSKFMALNCIKLDNQFLELTRQIRKMDPSERWGYEQIDQTDEIKALIEEKISYYLQSHSVCQPN